jgi:hypothetical protein
LASHLALDSAVPCTEQAKNLALILAEHPDLADVVKAWPKLSVETKRIIGKIASTIS